MRKFPHRQVIIWGHPLYSHTHSFIHEAFFKTFKFLGFKTFWFDDNRYPEDFNFNNSLFITEGFADKNIPILKNSSYVVMYPPNPAKYDNTKKFIEFRLIAKDFKDHISEYSFKPEENQKISEYFYLTEIKKNKFVCYTHWATNLLPEEFSESDVYCPRKIQVNFVGTISKKGINENFSNFKPFLKLLRRKKVNFYHYDPWKKPVSSNLARKLIQESLIAIDIRGPQHINQRLVTCRVLKNVSYGQFGLTNSKAIYDAMSGLVGFSENSEELFEIGLQQRFNYKAIIDGMKFCRAYHTYLNRCEDLLKII